MVKIRNKAFSLLSRRAYFSKQLSLKLKEKGFPLSEIEELIAEFTKRGWLNDQELAARYVEREKEKGYGARLILMKLREKAGDIEISMEESEEGLRNLIEKKHAKNLPEKKDKVIAALMRRGFSYDLINKALQEYM